MVVFLPSAPTSVVLLATRARMEEKLLSLGPKDYLGVSCHGEEGEKKRLLVNHWPAEHNARTSVLARTHLCVVEVGQGVPASHII